MEKVSANIPPDGIFGKIITDMEEIKKKLVDLENSGRWSKRGVKEDDKGTPINTEQRVVSILQSELGIGKDIVIERADRKLINKVSKISKEPLC